MPGEERVYMVMAEDKNGDAHLFSTNNLERAEQAFAEMVKRHGQTKGNWPIDDR